MQSAYKKEGAEPLHKRQNYAETSRKENISLAIAPLEPWVRRENNYKEEQ